MTVFTDDEIWLIQQMAKTRCARIAGQMAQMEAIAEKMRAMTVTVRTIQDADDKLAKELAPQYPMSYERVRRFIDGANGDEPMARLALNSNVPVSVLMSLRSMNKGT